MKIIKNSTYGSFSGMGPVTNPFGTETRLSPDELYDGMYVQSQFNREYIYIVRIRKDKYGETISCRESHKKFWKIKAKDCPVKISDKDATWEKINHGKYNFDWVDAKRGIWFSSDITKQMNREIKLDKIL